MRLRLYESAITSRSVFLRKICGPATFEFCNKIGPQRRKTLSARTSALKGTSGLVLLKLRSSHSDPLRTYTHNNLGVAYEKKG